MELVISLEVYLLEMKTYC